MKTPKLRANPDGRWFCEIPGTGRKRKYFGRDLNEAIRKHRTFVNDLGVLAPGQTNPAQAIRRANKAGVPVNPWAPRQLRHSIGTTLRKLHGIEAAQGYLGHSKPDTTLIYAERSEALVAQIALSLPRSLVDALGASGV